MLTQLPMPASHGAVPSAVTSITLLPPSSPSPLPLAPAVSHENLPAAFASEMNAEDAPALPLAPRGGRRVASGVSSRPVFLLLHFRVDVFVFRVVLFSFRVACYVFMYK